MNRNLLSTLRVLGVGAALSLSSGSYAQCTTFAAGVPATGWNDFTNFFNGAPCDPGTGCPLNEITDFEIWADEAYAMTNIQQGGEYTFSACNGVGGTAWPVSFTVVSPSGTIDAFGLDAGSNCALTWTASESGQYMIVVSEAGVACGESTNQAVDNGFPAITCTGSAATACPAAPVNDMCADAIVLTVGSDCVQTDGTTTFATEEMAPVECDGANSATAHEVWYQFTSSGEATSVQVTGIGTFDAVIELFSGTCGSLTPIDCEDTTFPTGPDPVNEVLNIPSLTAGTYYLRIFNWGQGPNSASHDFQICVTNTLVGMEEMAAQDFFDVYPNPSNGNLTLKGNDLSGTVNVEIFDLTGRKVHTASESVIGSTMTLQLEGKLSSGTYNIVLSTAEARSVEQVVIH